MSEDFLNFKVDRAKEAFRNSVSYEDSISEVAIRAARGIMAECIASAKDGVKNRSFNVPAYLNMPVAFDCWEERDVFNKELSSVVYVILKHGYTVESNSARTYITVSGWES